MVALADRHFYVSLSVGGVLLRQVMKNGCGIGYVTHCLHAKWDVIDFFCVFINTELISSKRERCISTNESLIRVSFTKVIIEFCASDGVKWPRCYNNVKTKKMSAIIVWVKCKIIPCSQLLTHFCLTYPPEFLFDLKVVLLLFFFLLIYNIFFITILSWMNYRKHRCLSFSTRRLSSHTGFETIGVWPLGPLA